MTDHKNHHEQMKFQLERILLFSDAVFAIAITLMVIEIKPPHLHPNDTLQHDLQLLAEKIPVFVSTIVSFILVGISWVRHHDIMRYLHTYNHKFIWLNIALLFSIALIPFAAAFVFENITTNSPLPIVVYNCIFILNALISYQLYMYALHPNKKLTQEDHSPKRQELKAEILFPIAVFSLVIIIACFNVSMAAIGYAAFGFQSFFTDKKKQTSRIKNKI